MKKPHITKTFGPIHFEDLDPHRFEDLIRELIYDYKDWRSIEATGRSGSDEGFDIRAYEKAEIVSQSEDENGEEVIEKTHPMEGNLWMIQGKRERAIGPKKLEEYLGDVDGKNSPYGYILAASADFSKKSYDIFRDVLRKKGVMEFYLWGKGDLEVMLHLPKNDRILFTFFGLSLVSKRRSRTAEIRSAVNIKNKLYKILGGGQNFHQRVLARDLKDVHYPYGKEYSDFEKKPRWKEYIAFGQHFRGLLCHKHEYMAYVNIEKKEWDFTKKVDLILPENEDNSEFEARNKQLRLVNDIYDFFPRKMQGRFIEEALISYTDIALIDEKGDGLFEFPHLYVDFDKVSGPFSGHHEFLRIGGKEIEIAGDYRRVNKFPKKFTEPKIGKIYKDKKISLDVDSLREFRKYTLDTLYDVDGKYSFLTPRDIIPVSIDDEGGEQHIQITHKLKAKIKDYLQDNPKYLESNRNIGYQLGREFNEKENINIYEFRMMYAWQLKEIGKSKN